MKHYLQGFRMSLGMFTAIPLPRHIWDDSCLNLVLPCFPLVGVLLGAIWWGFAELLVFSGVHVVLAVAVLTVLPFLLTGFLHLDGYMDTSDAVLSRRPLEDKLRILKDPHLGAFSAIMLAVLFVLQFSAVYAVIDGKKTLTTLVFITVMSRCCASMSLLGLSAMAQSGYANMLKQHVRVSHKVFVLALAAATLVASYPLAGLCGLVAVISVVLGFACAMAYSYKEFKGVSGDLAGFSLVISETCGLTALGVIQ